jgi:hypothetical protein
MAVFRGVSDPTPALYVSTLSPTGSLILRSNDGEHFVPVNQPEPDNSHTWAFRALFSFNERLYASPAGRLKGELIERNTAEIPVVYENADPAAAPWRPISEIGFGDASNATIYELASFDNFLYAGTFNPSKGFQLWKTDAQRYPYRWRKVLADGAFRGLANQAVASMCAFGDALYLGTGKQGLRLKSDWAHDPSLNAAEVIRVYPDDSWELIVGEPRHTFDGIKFPLSGMGPGFNNINTSVMWRMTEHDGWLYVGACNSMSFLRRLEPIIRRRGLRQPLGPIDDFSEQEAGFELWRSRDGSTWDAVTSVGFGNPHNYAPETMISTPAGLFVGTLTVPPNPIGRRGFEMDAEFQDGCEIWLGK